MLFLASALHGDIQTWGKEAVSIMTARGHSGEEPAQQGSSVERRRLGSAAGREHEDMHGSDKIREQAQARGQQSHIQQGQGTEAGERLGIQL